MKLIIKLTAIILAILVSCTNNGPNVSDELNIESVLRSLVDNDSALGMDGFGSSGDMDLDHEVGLESEFGLGKMLSDTLLYGQDYKIRFGRRIFNKERSIDFEVGVDTVIGSVTFNITGEFIVRAIDTTNLELIDSIGFSKEFSSYFYRKIRFVQESDLDSIEGFRWKIDAITPLTGGTGDKVNISNISLYSLDSLLNTGELIYSFDIDESGELYIDRDDLPIYTSFDKILIQAQVINNGPEFTMNSSEVGEWVFVNYGRSRMERGRRRLQDLGLNVDQAANDNIHSGIFRVHGPGPNQVRGVFRTFYETIDLSTIFVSDGGYNTCVWSIPYRVER